MNFVQKLEIVKKLLVLNLFKIIYSYIRSNPSTSDLSVVIRKLQAINRAIKVIYLFNEQKIILFAVNSYNHIKPSSSKILRIIAKCQCFNVIFLILYTMNLLKIIIYVIYCDFF